MLTYVQIYIDAMIIATGAYLWNDCPIDIRPYWQWAYFIIFLYKIKWELRTNDRNDNANKWFVKK